MDEHRCPSCSAEVRRGQTTCPACGKPLTFDPSGVDEHAGVSTSSPEDAHSDEVFFPVTRNAFDTYWPVGPLGSWLIIFLIGIAVISVVSIGSAILQDRLLAQIQQGVQVSPATIEANDSREMMIALLELGVMTSTATLFMIWFFRAHRNLTSFGVQGLKYAPWWTIGGFLVPFLNLVRPYQVMKEVWWGSDPAHAQGEQAKQKRSSSLVAWWWGSYLMMNLASTAVAQIMLVRSTEGADLRLATQLGIAASVLTIVAAVLAAGVVREISLRQAERWDRTFIGQG